MSLRPGIWAWSLEHNAPCQVVEVQDLWAGPIYRVWIPTLHTVVRAKADQLSSDPHRAHFDPAWLAYVTTATRISDALSRDILLAPVESSVIPLPHQLFALKRAVSGDRVRYLLADEVGLGKTIEAGLILRELKLRGQVRRTLVVAPKGLVSQWVAEMRTHFGEEFRAFLPSDFSAFRRVSGTDNVWRSYDQAVCSLDSVKPSDGRRGWSQDRLAEYNRERFDDLVSAGWDLIIVDEAHRLGGSTDQVARYRLGQGLADAAPHLLLLSATPHQGKTEPFFRLMSLLDERAFPDAESISRDRVAPYVIRTEKRRAINADGGPLFKPRSTKLVPIAWEDRHSRQRALYDAITEYVREGYNRAIREKRHYVGFLLLLMQRLVTSSTRAIRVTLERRLEALQLPEEQLGLFPELSGEDWVELDGQEQMEALLTSRLKGLRDERSEVRLLLDAARAAEAAASDPKAEALLSWIHSLQREQGDPELKVLIFTEFVPTQEMLRSFLADRGFSVVCLNGSMGMSERIEAQEAFAGDARIMVSTEAGGEGLNLQFCHVVINYDIPWNPMRLEQRIGRVDRIGQEHPVLAINLTLEDTVEHRVREVLEEKLALILKEFGVDKAGDILDSAEAGRVFDEVYGEAILHPERVNEVVNQAIERLREESEDHRQGVSLLGATEELDPQDAKRLLDHPLPHWVERMTTSFLRARGGSAERKERAWTLRWPGDEKVVSAVFSLRDAVREPSTQHLTLADDRIRRMVTEIPPVVPGTPVPVVRLASVPPDVRGVWSVWRIGLDASGWSADRILPLFLHDDGRVLPPSARFIWDQFLSEDVVVDTLSGGIAAGTFQRVEALAQEHGRQFYNDLLRAHEDGLAREREIGEFAFETRHRAVERIGLPAVREHRLSRLREEKAEWKTDLERRAATLPSLDPLLLVRVEGSGGGE